MPRQALAGAGAQADKGKELGQAPVSGVGGHACLGFFRRHPEQTAVGHGEGRVRPQDV